MIENRQQLMHAYEAIAKMNDLRERCAKEPLWHPSSRESVIDGIDAQMRKIEREIAEYLSLNAEKVA